MRQIERKEMYRQRQEERGRGRGRGKVKYESTFSLWINDEGDVEF